jgi:hypothetical protein
MEAIFAVLFRICPEELTETTKPLIQDRRHPGGDSNGAPPNRGLEIYHCCILSVMILIYMLHSHHLPLPIRVTSDELKYFSRIS